MFSLIQDALRLYPTAEALFDELTNGVTEAGRAIMRAMKIGKYNPNYAGIPEERRLRIQATMRRRDRRQVRNPFYGHRHTPAAKAAIRRARRAQRFRWAMEPGGQARRVALDFVLPVGWHWGHGNFNYRRRSPL